MELVYLWVEEYKNIKEQGFNFSPRFDCKYDKDSNELTIDENENYISIFPDNINVTAIVGENGSGKSSVLELLSNKFEDYNDKDFPIYENFVRFFAIYLYENTLLIANDNINLEHKNKIGSINVENIKETNNTSIKVKKLSEYDKSFDNLCSVFYSNTLSDIQLDLKPRESKSNTPYSKNISISSLLNNVTTLKQNEKNFGDYSKTGFSTIYRGHIANQTLNNIITIKSGVKFFFDIPTKIEIKNINFYQFLLKTKDEDFFKKNNEKLFNKYLQNKPFVKQLEINIITAILISIRMDTTKNNSFNKLDIDDIFLTLSKSENGLFRAIEKIQTPDFNIEIPSDLKSTYEKIISLIKDNKIKIDIDILELEFLEMYKKLIFKVEPFLDFKWGENKVLSTGEETLLSQLSNFKYYIEIYDEPNTPFSINGSLLILIDEGELALHPNWQRKYIKSYIDFFNKNTFSKTTHIIITSHSPFIISDLPKENVIFLDKNKKTGHCINSTEKMKDLNTFGANIHTLLSHGFFMEDGLMGEFAKEKIEEIKKFYELVKKFKEKEFSSLNSKSNLKHIFLEQKVKFRHIQSIIGEPFLQTVIKNYLDELEIMFNGKKLFLQNEIKRLQELESSL